MNNLDLIKIDRNKYKIIPIRWYPSRYHNIIFEGWPACTIDANDDNFSIMICLAQKTVDNFFEIYGDTHAFTEPSFCWRSDGCFSIKIGTMENEEYEGRNA